MGALVASAGQPVQVARAAPAAPVIETAVGTGDPGNSGDGGQALEATLDRPQSLTTARDGTLYVVSGYRIRAVDPEGKVSTVYAGKAKAGRHDGLGGLAVAPDGTLYFADTDGDRVRAFDPAKGTVETVAGNGKEGAHYEPAGDGGPATRARVARPAGLAVGRDGTLYIADTGNYKIRAVHPKTGRISSVLGPEGSAWHGSATGLAVIGRTLYLSDSDVDTVTALDLDDHTTKVVADDATPGLRGNTFFEHPTDLAAGADGRLYIACSAEANTSARLSIVYALDPKKGSLEVVAGGAKSTGIGDGGPAVGASIGGPNHTEVMGVAVDPKGTVYVADATNHRVRAVRDEPTAERTTHAKVSARDISTVAGGGKKLADGKEDGLFYRDEHRRHEVHLGLPTDVAVDQDGTVYIADPRNDRVRAVDPADGKVRTIAGKPPEPDTIDDANGDGGPATKASLTAPTKLALGPGHVLYVSESGYEGHVRVIDLDEGTIDTLRATAHADDQAADITVSRSGVLYVAYLQDQKVCAVHPGTDTCETVMAKSGQKDELDAHTLKAPSALAVDRDGSLLIADAGANRIARLDQKTGKLSTVAGVFADSVSLFADRNRKPTVSGDGGPARSADLGIVSGIDVGPDRTLYLTDATNHRVRAIDQKTGVIRAVAGTGTYRQPAPEDIADDGHVRNDGGAFAGDGGRASKAKLDQPQAVTVGPDGVLYVADAGNDRIRAIGDVDLPEGGPGVGPVPFTVGLALGALLLAAVWFGRRQRVSSARIR